MYPVLAVNSFLYAVTFFFPQEIFAFPEIPLMAFLPTFFNPEDLITSFFKALSFANASFPIEVTFLPIVTLVRLLQSANALSDISVTRKLPAVFAGKTDLLKGKVLMETTTLKKYDVFLVEF